jgi:hypothetical protein
MSRTSPTAPKAGVGHRPADPWVTDHATVTNKEATNMRPSSLLLPCSRLEMIR